MSTAQTATAHLLEARTFAKLELGAAVADALAEACAVWTAVFAGRQKFLLRGDVATPSGYIPLCLPAGCDMKESFYARTTEYMPPSVRPATLELISLLREVACAVAEEVCEVGGQQLVRAPTTGCLRVMQYPALEGGESSALMRSLEAGGLIRTVAHTDLNALTILPAATAPGLELRTPEGWEPFDIAPNEVLIHAGRELEARSEGRWRATEHRVRNPVGEERRLDRLAFAFFVS